MMRTLFIIDLIFWMVLAIAAAVRLLVGVEDHGLVAVLVVCIVVGVSQVWKSSGHLEDYSRG